MTAVPIKTTRDVAAGPSLLMFLNDLRRAEEVRPGDVIGGCTVLRLLGAGGMGLAFEAVQAPLDRRVVLKVLYTPASDAARRRFERERQLQAVFVHHGIVPVLAAGRDGDREYMVMSYARGVTLRDALRGVRGAVRSPDWAGRLDLPALVARIADDRDRDHVRPWLASAPPPPPLADEPPAEAKTLPADYHLWACDRMVEIADALHAAHGEGVLHLDVKPSNILIESEGAGEVNRARLFDFGVGRRVSPRPAAEYEKVGTEGYTAPEVLDGRFADARADVYSLGRCLRELVTLRPSNRDGHSAAPADLQAIARKATRPEPGERYQTADDLAADLHRWRRGEPTTALPRNTFARLLMWVKRHPRRAAAAAVVVASLLAVVVTAAAMQVLGAKAVAAEARAETVKEQAARAQAEFAKAVADAQRELSSTPPRTGWTKRVLERLGESLRLRPGEDVRDTAVDTLVGLDVEHVYPHEVPAVEGRIAGFAAVAFSPDGTKVVAGGWGRPGTPPAPAAVWDGHAANKPVATTRSGSGPVAFPDADSPLTLLPPAGDEKGLTLWNVGTNKPMVELPLPGPGNVGPSALSPDAAFAAAVFTPTKKLGGPEPKPLALLWAIDRKPAVATAKRLADWEGDTTALAFSPDGKLLAGGTADGGVSVRTTSGGKELFILREGDLTVTGLGFGRNYRRPSGRRDEKPDAAADWLLGVGCQGGDLSVWNLRTRSRLNTLRGSEHAVLGVAFSPDGTTLASCGRETPFIWDVASGRPLLRVTRLRQDFLRNWTEGVAFSPAGDRVAFGSGATFGPGGLDVFRLENDRGVRTYRGLAGVVEKVWLTPDGTHVAALSQNWQLGVWERDTGRVKYVWDVPAGWFADNSAFALDGATVLFASGKHATRWDLNSGERVDSWALDLGLNDHLLLRPDKPPLLLRRDPVGRPNEHAPIRAHELGPKGERTELYNLIEKVFQREEIITASPDGRVVVTETVGNDRRSHLFDGRTGTAIPVESDTLPLKGAFSLSDSGAVIWAVERLTPTAVRTHVVRLADMKRLGTHPMDFLGVDDAGKLGVDVSNGVHLYRLGEDRPLVTFDPARPPVAGSVRLSPDGKFVSWGRRDGTVCVADVNRCLEQLAPFGKR